jgi:NADP-dependent 3-hydroxy acid dehydrogenase YdfG
VHPFPKYRKSLSESKSIFKTGVKDGQVIFINSICGHKTFAEGKMVFYNASKLALTCVVEGWRREVHFLKILRLF